MEEDDKKLYKFEIVFRTDMEEHTEEIREYIEDTFGVQIVEINQGEDFELMYEDDGIIEILD